MFSDFSAPLEDAVVRMRIINVVLSNSAFIVLLATAARLDMMLAHDRSDEIASIDRPSFIIGTVDDATIPYYFAEYLHTAIPGSQMTLFEDAGHDSYRRHPEKWNTTIEAFLKKAEKRV